MWVSEIVFPLKGAFHQEQKMATVCDVSVLQSPDCLEAAKKIVKGPFYFPSSTYAWLAREKVISVRDVVLTYSLVNRFVREGDVIVAYLPEILDEVARRLLFEIEREIPLSDLRAVLLSGHLRLPFLTLDLQVLQKLKKKGEILWEFPLYNNRIVLREVLCAYRNLAEEVGKLVYNSLSNGGLSAAEIIQELKARRNRSVQSLISSLERLQKADCEVVNFKFLFLDLSGPLRDFLTYHTLRGRNLRDVCEKSLCLAIAPNHQFMRAATSEST